MTQLSFQESVRLRPGMYLGNEGVIGIFKGLITDCIALCNTDKILFSVSILGENKFSFGVNSESDVTPFLQHFNDNNDQHLFPKLLFVLTTKFEITGSGREKTLYFEFDKTVIKSTAVDYHQLTDELANIALLNRGVEIVVKDSTLKFVNQAYYHFPQGIFYLSERLKKAALKAPQFQVEFDGIVDEHKYQIAIAYRGDWYPSPAILSFVKNKPTGEGAEEGGALVMGVFKGLVEGCRKYVKKNKLQAYKIRQRKFGNGLIMVCSVREADFSGGNMAHEAGKIIEPQAKKIVTDLVYNYLQNNKEIADSFLWRFDDKKMGSAVY